MFRLESPHKNFLAVFLLLLAILAVYFPSVKNNDFVNWDDDVHLLVNPFVEKLDAEHLVQIFTTTVNWTYIPLTSLTFAVERNFFGLNPFVYHLNNMLLHMAVCCLVMLLARRFGLGLLGATVAALIFGLHPMHVESVAWVTERKDVLCAVFYLGALCSYSFYIQEGISGSQKRRLYGLILALAFLSVLAKPMAASLILIFFLVDWFGGRPFSKSTFLEKIPFLFVIYPSAWLTYILVRQNDLSELVFPDSILRWIWFLAFYLRKFFFPDFFVLRYALPEPGFNEGYLAAAFICLVVLLSILFWRRHRLYLFAVLFYLVSIIIVLRQDVVADRFMYLPSLGFCLWLGAGVELLLKHRSFRMRMAAVVLTFLLVGGFGWKAFLQTKVWRDGITLWEHQHRYQSKAEPALVFEKLGEAYLNAPAYRRAIFNIHKYKRINDLNKDGELLMESNAQEIGRIVYYLTKAIEISPKSANPYYSLGRVYFDLGHFVLAKKYVLRAIFYQPKHFDAYFLIAKINYSMGLHQEAIASFEKAIEVFPDHQRMLKKVGAYFDALRGMDSWSIYAEAMDRFLMRFGER